MLKNKWKFSPKNNYYSDSGLFKRRNDRYGRFFLILKIPCILIFVGEEQILKPLFFEKNEIKWNQTTMIFMGFLWFHHENRLVVSFHYYTRNQCVKICKYGEFDGNRKVYLFGTTPLIGFGSFFFKFHFTRKIMILGKKCMKH